jgi:hypothetical protein
VSGGDVGFGYARYGSATLSPRYNNTLPINSHLPFPHISALHSK